MIVHFTKRMYFKALLYIIFIAFANQASAQNCTFQIRMASDTVACKSEFPPPFGTSTPVQFSVTPSLTGGVAASYVWSDGSTNRTLRPATPGTYTVSVSDVTGCVATASVVVREYGTPGSFEASTLAVGKTCFGTPTQFTPHSTSIDQFQLFFGDGASTLPGRIGTVDHTYTSPGPFNVILKVTNRCGFNADVTSSVTLSQPPSPTIPETVAICNTPVVLDANSNNLPNMAYLWSNGSTNKTLTVANPDGISVTVTDLATVCSTTAGTVAFDGRPLVDLGPDLSICQPNNGPILDARNTGSTFAWTINGTPASTNQTIQASSGTPGVFEYAVVITNTATSCVSGDAVKITVNPAAANPVITLSDGRSFSGSSLSLCQFANTTLTATHPSPSTFSWSLNGGAAEKNTSVSVPTDDVTNLNYALTTTVTATGCSAVSQFSLAIKPTPDRPTIKMINATTLESSAATGNQWYKEGFILSGQAARQLGVSVAGNYTVRTTVNACTSSTSDIFPFGITGVDKEEEKLEVYPNPATELLYVKFGKPGAGESLEIFIIDMTGRAHLQQYVQNNSAVSISDLTPGLYTLMAITEGRTHLQRFVKY